MRGPAGVGKSTWIKENGLEMYTLSADQIRLMIQSPVIMNHGRLGISQKNDAKVWSLLFEMLEARMSRGEFVVIDATHTRNQQINKYRKLAKKYRYRVSVKDLSDSRTLGEILEQNRERDEHKFVPEEVIKTMYERTRNEVVPSWVNTIDTMNDMQLEPLDFDKYKKVFVFGDIHGCVDTLRAFDKKIGFHEDNYHIFCGDYFDRGIQNAETFEVLNRIRKKENILLLKGNHELHLNSYIQNGYKIEGDYKIPRRTVATFQEFENSETIENKQILSFWNSLAQMAYFHKNGNVYICTHGGLPIVPDITTPSIDFVKGVGRYSDYQEVDTAFCSNNCSNIYSIHGHRGDPEVIETTPQTYNLVGNAEIGGNLVVLEIGEEVTIHKFKNDTFDVELVKEREKAKVDIVETHENLFELLEEDKNINVKHLHDDIYSANFSKKVFRNRAWNNITTKIRGLFITDKSKIVARSYNKFFNWGEVDSTSSKELNKNLVFPVTAWNKYNGFLGILSVHEDEWFIASKSTDEGEFKEMFEKLVRPHLTDEMKKWVRDENVTLVFEVIDIEKDPHIIEYEDSHLVLLDIIFKEQVYKEADYSTLKSFSTSFGFNCKTVYKKFYSWGELQAFRRRRDKKDVFEEDTEGFVFEDATGFKWKYKSPFYNFWKKWRGIVQTIKKKGYSNDVKGRLHTYADFKVWNTLKDNDLDLDRPIINIRKDIMRYLDDSK